MRYLVLVLALLGVISAAAVSISYADPVAEKGQCEGEPHEDAC